MSLRSRIVLIVLPLIIAPMVVLGFVATFSARNSVTAIASRFLRFKAESISDYLDGQWQLLQQNALNDNPSFIEAMGTAVGSFAQNSIRQKSELIFAMDEAGDRVFETSDFELTPAEGDTLMNLMESGVVGWQRLSIGEIDRVAVIRDFPPLGWSLYVTEDREAFYRETELIILQTMIILGAALVVSIILLFVFALYITRPLKEMVATMTDVIKTQNLKGRVDILYKDETGTLGNTFNIMLSELEQAYEKIKGYALRAAVSNLNERKVRNIFQKYVPKNVIERIFEEPESMLVGENRVLAVLFSDIRDFTALSERMSPEHVVDSLNHYFSIMVDLIVGREGIVDKYIGDAIMAFFGAPVSSEDDAYQSVCAGLDMIDALDRFNDWQRKQNRPEFRIGIGINYGSVTVGNIGSDKKMDYTVIGDMVNLASRLEGLTKIYGERLIISESVYRTISDRLPCRLLDRVVVKGRSIAGGIYAVRRKLESAEEDAWRFHHDAVVLYYKREFEEARNLFDHVQSLLPRDKVSRLLSERCEQLSDNAPPPDWTGVIEMDAK